MLNLTVHIKSTFHVYYINCLCRLTALLGSDVFSTSTDGEVMWWDIRKLVEPVETLQLEYSGYMPGQRLGGVVMEYESTMVNLYMIEKKNRGKKTNNALDLAGNRTQIYSRLL